MLEAYAINVLTNGAPLCFGYWTNVWLNWLNAMKNTRKVVGPFRLFIDCSTVEHMNSSFMIFSDRFISTIGTVHYSAERVGCRINEKACVLWVKGMIGGPTSLAITASPKLHFGGLRLSLLARPNASQAQLSNRWTLNRCTALRHTQHTHTALCTQPLVTDDTLTFLKFRIVSIQSIFFYKPF